jgi:gliding motility-associated-like protein
VIFRANETTTNIGINDWQWKFGDGQTGAGTPVTNTYTANGQYTVTLYATSTEGCKDTATDIINIYGTDANAGADVIAAPNQPIQLQASGGVSYQWIPPNAGLSATNIPNPIAINTTDNYYVLKAFTPSGCASYDTIRIFIYKGPEVYFPTAFTPNGDGLNETIKPFLVGVVNFKYFAIFNRYGQKMFYTTNPNKGWDGTYRGQKQPMGTYVWVVEGNYYNSATNVPRVWKGTVMILK